MSLRWSVVGGWEVYYHHGAPLELQLRFVIEPLNVGLRRCVGVSLFYTWACASLLVCIDFSVRLATFLAVDLVGIFLVSSVFFFCCPLYPNALWFFRIVHLEAGEFCDVTKPLFWAVGWMASPSAFELVGCCFGG